MERVTVGVGPVIWAGHHGDTRLVLRLVPIVGLTEFHDQARGTEPEWSRSAATLSGGVLATSLVVLVMAGLVAGWERATRRRCLWGRIVIADAVVLSVFNLLPVPPLDGGRAMLSLVASLSGAPLSADALFWFHVGGLAAAVVPMALWTGWTRRIDAAALRWRAPE